MKRSVDYIEVQMKFVLTSREAVRATDKRNKALRNACLSAMLAEAVTGNTTNSLDAEDIVVTIDGKVCP